MYLTESEMTEILRRNGLEPKYPIYEYENEEQGRGFSVNVLSHRAAVIGVNDDPQFILPVPPRPDLRVASNNVNTQVLPNSSPVSRPSGKPPRRRT